MKLVVSISCISAEAYRARCPSLPGCAAYGRSHEEAVRCLERAVQGYLASLDVVWPGPLQLQVLGGTCQPKGAAVPQASGAASP